MSLFDNGGPEVFFSVRNFNMTLAASEMLEAVVKCQYFRNLVRGEGLHQFDLLSADL